MTSNPPAEPPAGGSAGRRTLRQRASDHYHQKLDGGGRGAVLATIISIPVVLLAALIGAGATVYSKDDNGNKNELSDSKPSTSVGSTVKDSLAPSVSSPAAASPSPSVTPSVEPSADEVRWSGRVRLTYVDLDSVPAKVLSSNSRASTWVSYGYSGSDKNVLYGLNGGFFTTEPSIAVWEGAAILQPTRRQCADLISTQGTETIPITDDNRRFCVKTAAGRVAYLAIKKFDKESGYLADVTVWERTEE